MNSLQPIPSSKTLDSTYMEFLYSLINTLTQRIIKFYHNQKLDELIFKQQLLTIQQSLYNYQSFKIPLIKYSPLIQPLLITLESNDTKPYYMNAIITQDSEADSQNEFTLTKKSKKKIYSSKQTLDPQKTHYRSISIGSTSSKKNWNTYNSHQKIGNTTFYLPEVDYKRDISEPKKRNKQSKSHNFQKQISNAYDRIIGSVLNSKGFRKRRYHNKVDEMVRISQRSQLQ